MELKDIPTLLSRQAAADPMYAAFGSATHKYRLNNPIALDALEAFEVEHQIRLPEDYRKFLLCVGNGGAGPYYGIFPLGFSDGSGTQLEPWEAGDGGAGVLRREFPHSAAWNFTAEQINPPEYANDDEAARWRIEQDEKYWHPNLVDGAFPVCHQGCAYRNLLIVTGAQRGNIWLDARASDGGLLPVSSSNGNGISFSEWYLSWLENPSAFM